MLVFYMSDVLKICFVCSGNTCRSIMAERIAKKIIKDKKILGVKISSKGVFAKRENISENAKAVLCEMGCLKSNRKSVKLKKIDICTLYVAMTDSIKKHINGKVISMRDLLGFDIIDPIGKNLETYSQVGIQIYNGVEILFNKILKIRSEIWLYLQATMQDLN